MNGLELASNLVETLGTFFFLTIILVATGVGSYGNVAPFAISAGLLASILFGGYVSGGHFNPAVTFMMLLRGGISQNVAVGYVVSQLVGAFLATKMYEIISGKNLKLN